MTRFRTASNPSISLPYEGMDLQTPLPTLPVTRAPWIQNFFINGQTLQVRYGTRVHSNYSSFDVSDINLGAGVYNKSDGTQELYALYLIALGPTAQIVNYSSSSASVAHASGPFSGSSNTGPAYFVQFRTVLYVFYGGGTPVQYDGTTWGALGFTGPTLNTLQSGNVYRNRLYLVERNSTKVWYGGVDSTSGAMTSFDVGSVLANGGNLSNVYPISYGDSSAANQYLAFVTSQGEILYYQGAYPGSPDWTIVSRAKVGAPLSIRTFVFFQGDVLLCTTVGLASLRDILKIGGNAGLYATISQPIDPYWRLLSKVLDTEVDKTICGYSSNTGCIYIHFHASLARNNNEITNVTSLLGIPITFVYNTIAGSWTYYIWTNPDTVSDGNPGQLSAILDFGNKVVAIVYNYGSANEIEKTGVYNDQQFNSPSSTVAIASSVLSSAFITPQAGGVVKTNAISVYGYFGASTQSALTCALIENFGTAVSRVSRPQVIINSVNRLPLSVGSVAPYVQYNLGVETNASSGLPTMLYSLNILKEDGGFG